MKILLSHNRYQRSGGEDTVYAAEKSVLRERGNDVVEYMRNNDEIESYSSIKKASLYWTTTWSKKAYEEVRQLCRKHKPDVAHFHNTLPLISPSAYYACRDENVPVIQTLHNYRLVCPGALLMRDGKVCEECLSDGLGPALKHHCYRNSRIQTMAVARMLKHHRKLNTWHHVVDKYIALTEFSKSKFVEGGLPEEKIAVKPNFIGGIDISDQDNGYAFFLGRLSREKGADVLLKAWRNFTGDQLVLTGDGPEKDALEAEYSKLANVTFTGNVGHDEAVDALCKSSFLILPSLWYETFGLTVVEAFACGKPVIVSRIGALAEIVDDGVTGLHFTPGDPDDLAEKVNWMISHPDERRGMGENARRVYEEKYAPQRNYEMLMNIYSQAIEGHRSNNGTNCAS